MKAVIIGSYALQYHEKRQNPNKYTIPIPKETKVKDVDIICEGDEEYRQRIRDYFSTKKLKVEFHNLNLLNNALALSISGTSTACNKRLCMYYASLNLLYAIKRSHAFRPKDFDKTMFHINQMKLIMTPYDIAIANNSNFLKQRIELTKLEFGDKTPKLNKSNEAFFDDAVKKMYDHDSIHRAVAFGNVPVYEMMKRDFSMAKCEKDMWDKLPYEQRIKAVVEEGMVIALERFILPNKLKNQRLAFLKALEKICTTLTSGWFRDFAIDNYSTIMHNVTNVDYVKRLVQNQHLLLPYGVKK